MKQYKKIFLLFFLILLVSSIIAPLVKSCFDALLPSNSFVVQLLHYEDGNYNFARVMRRIIMVVAILLIVFLRKPLMFNTFRSIGLGLKNNWWQQLQTGIFLSTGIFVFYIAFLYGKGILTFQVDEKSAVNLISELLTFALIAVVVGCIEEIIFRGFILQNILKDTKVISAVLISSIFYSLLHFFKAELLVSRGFQPFIGFVVVYHSFAHIVVEFTDIYPLIIGLFLVGIVLSYAYLQTKSLYLAIGLHAGWVFLIKSYRLFFDHVGPYTTWLFGDRKIITGLSGWLLLIVTLILIRYITRLQYHEKKPAGTC